MTERVDVLVVGGGPVDIPGEVTLVTREDLERLVAEGRGEWERVEYKKSTGELEGGMRTLCAFLNGSGGRVFFGVTDAGKIVGQEVSESTFQAVADAIRKIEPPIGIEQVRIPLDASREVLILQAGDPREGIYVFDGRPYWRIGKSTSRMPQTEYQRRLMARPGAQEHWERQTAKRYTLDDLDLPEIERTLRGAVSQNRLEALSDDPVEALDRLHLRVEARITQAAAVLFGRKLMPDYPQCILRMARFKGNDKTEFLDHRQFHGHAFLMLDEAISFILRNIPIAGRIEPGRLERQDTPLYPTLALREALVNAICHRDYSIVGGSVNVAIFDDRLEVISVGLLPPGITVADLKRRHVSRPRNPLIADVFYLRGLIEQWGRGTQKIVDWCVAAGQPEPEFEESAGAVTVRFRPSGYHPPLRVSHDLTDRQRRILQALASGERRKLKEILNVLRDPPSTRTLQGELSMMRSLGLIESSGHGAGARWRLRLDQE